MQVLIYRLLFDISLLNEYSNTVFMYKVHVQILMRRYNRTSQKYRPVYGYTTYLYSIL
jgi:hypothetical protein